MEGWIKIHRRLLDWEWYTDSVTKDVFLHLLLTANHQPRRWKGEELEAGSVVTSLGNLAESLGFSVKQIRTALKHLEETGEILKKRANKNTIIILHNYAIYQGLVEDEGQSKGNQKALTGQLEGTQRAGTLYNKNVRMKECKNEREGNAPTREEVKAFAHDEHLTLDCDKFFDHYAAVGWMIGGMAIQDWRAKAREWSAKDSQGKSEPSFSIQKYNEYLERQDLKYG